MKRISHAPHAARAGAYAVCQRVYNGDVTGDAVEAVSLLLALSATLAASPTARPAAAASSENVKDTAHAGQLPGTAAAALHGIRQRIALPSALVRPQMRTLQASRAKLRGLSMTRCLLRFAQGYGGASFAPLVAADVAALLACGRPALVCALNHVRRMVLAAAEELLGGRVPKPSQRRTALTGKKARNPAIA